MGHENIWFAHKGKNTKGRGKQILVTVPYKFQVSDSAESPVADPVSSESTASTSPDELSEKSRQWSVSRNSTNFPRWISTDD